VLFLGNASTPAIRAAMRAGELGQMCSPAEHRDPLPDVPFAADNGCFGRGWVGERKWLAWLARVAPHADRCLFATAPDVVGDAAATLARSRPHLAAIRDLGYPAGLVAQEGLDALPVPWDEFDVLFVGGRDTAWKLGPVAACLVAQALQHRKKVHFGRCNSAKRWRYADSLGCHSADGTFLIYAPEANLARFRRWSTPHHPIDTGQPTPTHPVLVEALCEGGVPHDPPRSDTRRTPPGSTRPRRAGARLAPGGALHPGPGRRIPHRAGVLAAPPRGNALDPMHVRG
jgi:hypothetical protein